MSRFPARFVALAALAVASSAPAIDLGFGLLKRRQNPSAQQQQSKPDPAQRVKQLVGTLQTDPDVAHRKAAVDDLSAADARGNAEVVAALTGSLQRDPSPAVRAAVAQALGEAKSAGAAAVLAEVEKSDPDAGVRAAAKTALWRHQLNAQKVSGSTAPAGEPAFARPPVSASPRTVAPPATDFRPITQGPGRGGFYRETAEPPFAAPKPTAAPTPVAVAPPQPMPLPTPTAQPGDLPPLSIPLVPPVIVAPPPGPGLPTIVPPGK